MGANIKPYVAFNQGFYAAKSGSAWTENPYAPSETDFTSETDFIHARWRNRKLFMTWMTGWFVKKSGCTCSPPMGDGPWVDNRQCPLHGNFTIEDVW